MQQKKPVLLPVFLSILLAAATWLLVERLDIAYGLQKYFLHPAVNMQHFQQTAGGSLFKSMKIVIVLLLIVFVLYAVTYFILFETVALLYFFTSSRWHNPAVFISYKNTEHDSPADTTAIARSIKKGLEQKKIRVHFFEYTKTMKHDEVNYQIQGMLRKADAMVVVPDPYHPSYVNTEIQCAAYAEKPVFIIKHTKDQKLPDTANSGHTVLLLDKLKKQQFKPLVHLLQYVHKNWHTRLFIPGKPFTYFFEAITGIIEGIQTYALAFAGFILAVFLLIHFAVPVPVVLIILKIVVALIGFAAAFITLQKIGQNLHLQKTIRQSVLNAGKTHELYEEAGFEKNILDCIDKTGLRTSDIN